jgi:hypothetical protein
LAQKLRRVEGQNDDDRQNRNDCDHNQKLNEGKALHRPIIRKYHPRAAAPKKKTKATEREKRRGGQGDFHGFLLFEKQRRANERAYKMACPKTYSANRTVSHSHIIPIQHHFCSYGSCKSGAERILLNKNPYKVGLDPPS